jgi:uncharacterized protein YkwD
MSKLVLARIVLGALVCALLVPAPAAAAGRLVAADPLESAVVGKVNAVRKASGLQPLVSRPALERAAEDHALDMAQHGYFSHSWSSGASFSSWIRHYWPGPSFRGSWSVGENLYWRGPTITATNVVRGWMSSPPHRRNLLTPRWRAIGVGAVEMIQPTGAFAGVSQATVVAAEFGYKS